MTTDHRDGEEEELIRRACDAAMHNDAAALSEALRCHGNSISAGSLHAPLLNSTKEAQTLHNRLFRDFSSSEHSQTANGGRRILRALLMAPPAFATPWLAAFQFIARLQDDLYLSSRDGPKNGSSRNPPKLSRSSLRSSITEIQSFLQQAVSTWWEQERRRNLSAKQMASHSSSSDTKNGTTGSTPRDWILRLIKKLVEPLIIIHHDNESPEAQQQSRRGGGGGGGEHDDYWMVPLELVATIVCVMHDFEASLNQEILDCIFSLPHIRPDRLLPWLGLAADLHTFLRPSDWKMLLLTLQRRDKSAGQVTAFSVQQDLPGLMTAVVSLSSTLLPSIGSNVVGQQRKRSTSRDMFKAWKRVALNLLHAASTDASTFSTVTTVFQERLSGLSSESLQEWICMNDEDDASAESASVDDSTPDWVNANIILAAMRSARTSGSSMVDSLLSRALSNTKGHYDVSFEGWKALMGLACTDDSASTRKRGKPTSHKKSWIKEVEKFLNGASYSGNGCFDTSTEGSTRMLCNQAGRLIYQSLFFKSNNETGESSERVAAIYVVDRAQDWISAANSRLKSHGEILTSQEVVVIAVAFITVFCEVPMSRSFVVRGMAQSLSGENDFLHSKGDIALLNCLIISVIVKSNPGNIADTTALNPIVDILAAGKLDKTTFCALVQAIASTSSSAQQGILALSRKRLRSPSSNVLWGAENFNENCDRIQCSLFSLCILIRSPEWNENIAEAWKILSEVIVLNRPALPVAARTWLFSQIQGLLLDSESFGQEAVDRINRACLLRLLQFVGNDKSSSQANIDPQSIFTVWTTSDARPTQCTPTEDIAGLYKLIVSLFFRTSQSEGTKNSKALIKNGRLLLLRSCCSDTSVESKSNFSIKEDNDQILHCTLAISLILSAIGFIKSLSLGTLEVEASLDKKSMTAELISREQEASSSFRPMWLKSLADLDHDYRESLDPPEAAIRELAFLLCDTVATFLSDHRWSFAVTNTRSPNLGSQQKELLLGLSSLAERKKAFSHGDSPRTSGVHSNVNFSLQGECADISAFLVASAVFVDSAFSEKLGIHEVSPVFSMIMDSIDDVKDALTEDLLDKDLSPILYGLWFFYTRVCDEGASLRLISYLEESMRATTKGSTEISNRRFFLEAIASPDEIDSEIRSIRYSTLSALNKCMHAAVKHSTGLQFFTTSPSLEPFDCTEQTFRWSLEPKTKPIGFLVTCLEKLVSDLQTGLEGQSGGISTEMYLAYLDSLEMISNLLALHVRNSCGVPEESLSFHDRCSESALKMQTVLCSFPPTKKSPFVKAFLLAARTIPMLARCATRKVLLSAKGSESLAESAEVVAGLRRIGFAVASFEGCTNTLKIWIEREPSFRISWTKAILPQMSDDEHSMLLDWSSPTKANATGMASPSSPSERLEVPSVVTVPKQSTHQNLRGKECTVEAGAKLSLSSKDMWSWTCSSALMTMESGWLETIEALNLRDTPRASKTNQLPLSACAICYIQQRMIELNSVCDGTRLAFVEIGDERETSRDAASKDNEKAKTEKFLVEFIPSDAKIRLCSLFDRMVTATGASIKVLDSFVQQTTKNDPPALCFLEALVCMLIFCKVGEPDSLDFFDCFREWHEAEKRGLNRSRESNQYHTEGRGIMRHFPRVLFRMEKLESSLSKLYKVLNQDNKSNFTNAICLEKLKALDDLLANLNTRGIHDSRDTFCVMVKKRLDLLVQARLKHERNGQGNAPTLLRVGKRKRRSLLQEHHRRPIRSRNTTVDNWLRSDQQMGEEDADDDAFLDLEDFVADG